MEHKVEAALNKMYSTRALAKWIERKRRTVEMQFLSTEYFDEDADGAEF